MIHFQMRFAWDRNCSLYKQSCNRLILGLVGSVGATLSCGHGWGQGSQRWVAARRWPPAECDAGEGAQVEGHKKASKSRDPSLPEVSTKKLTTFFSRTPAAAAAAAAENVRALPSIPESQTSRLRHCCLLLFASVHSSSPLTVLRSCQSSQL